MFHIEKSDSDLNGLLRKFTQITKHNNLYTDNDIILNASSTYFDSNNISVTVDYYNDKGYWISENKTDQWYQIDLKNNKVKLSGYDYRAPIYNFFERWVVEGSNGEEWVKLDERTFNISKSQEKKTFYFECNQNVSDAFSMFRLTVGGNRGWDENYLLAIFRVELYGTIYLPSFYTFQMKHYSKIWYLFFISIAK